MLKGLCHAEGLELRSAHPQDHALLEALFRSARDYLYRLPLPREHVELLISQQYQLQQASYAQQWPAARTFVVERMGVAIGKLMLDEGDSTVHIIDLVLDPAMRGQGYGTTLVRAVQSAAGERRVGLSVDRQNAAAKKLYARLGFRVDAVSDSHESMSWAAARPHLSVA